MTEPSQIASRIKEAGGVPLPRYLQEQDRNLAICFLNAGLDIPGFQKIATTFLSFYQIRLKIIELTLFDELFLIGRPESVLSYQEITRDDLQAEAPRVDWLRGEITIRKVRLLDAHVFQHADDAAYACHGWNAFRQIGPEDFKERLSELKRQGLGPPTDPKPGELKKWIDDLCRRERRWLALTNRQRGNAVQAWRGRKKEKKPRAVLANLPKLK